jgi:hypothetical protein
MGATMMPAMSAAFQTLERAAVARASTSLNIIQRVGGSIGTAVLAIVLQHQITDRVPAAHGGGLSAAQSVPAAVRAQIAPKIAAAFGSTFWWALVLTVLAFLPALLLPRKLTAEAAAEAGGPAPERAREAVPAEA